MKQQSKPKIRPNILAIYTEEDGWRSDRDIASCLWYWDLLELTRKMPMKFSSMWAREEYLTDRQKAEKDGFIRPATEHAMHLWEDMPDIFQPMPVTQKDPWFGAPVQKIIRDRRNEDTEFTSLDRAIEAKVDNLLQDLSRDEVLNAPPQARILVTAPPGTGKTHLMLDRLEQLMHLRDITDPHRDILVLSFTRATVSDIIRRLNDRVEQGAVDALRYINIRTFDSLVTRFLLLDQDADILPEGYEPRIQWFLKMLETNQIPEAIQQLTAVRCLIVDELQDLTGIRAKLVLALTKLVMDYGGGVFFLGDPAQAIYDFDRHDGLTGHEFIHQFIHLAGPELMTWHLKTYFRFSNPALQDLAHRLRQSFGEDGLGSPSMEVLPTIRQAISLKPLTWLLNIAHQQKVAVLVYDNLEVYELFDFVRRAGVRVEVKSRQNYWPAWVARLVWGIPGDFLSDTHLKRLWEQRVAERVPESWDEAVELLHQKGVIKRGRLDLIGLGELVREQAPNPLNQSGLFVTTIHQSKGLEYDVVAILEPRSRNLSGNPEEVRKMYVAATRAKRELVMLARESNVFTGYRKDDYQHFQRFKNQENAFLLNGLADLSLARLWQCPPNMSPVRWDQAIRSQQDSWWEEFWGLDRDMKLPWSLSSDNDASLLQLSHGVHSDLKLMVSRYQLPRAGSIELPVIDLVSVASPISSNIAGTAALFIVPWVFGWGRVETREV